jgi:hypothetical protein
VKYPRSAKQIRAHDGAEGAKTSESDARAPEKAPRPPKEGSDCRPKQSLEFSTF